MCLEYGRFEAKIREIREQMLQTTTGNGGGGIQSQQQTGRFVRYVMWSVVITHLFTVSRQCLL